MEKHDLKDVTFLFLIRIDSVERLENLLGSIYYINQHFFTNIEIWEITDHHTNILSVLTGQMPNTKHTLVTDYDDVLFRTKYLNQMINCTETEYAAIWDTDIIIPFEQILESVSLLRRGEADFVYPYKSKFINVPNSIRKVYLKNNDMNFLVRNIKKMTPIYGDNPVGGAFMCRILSYKDIGLENECYYGWGREDGDRYYRWLNSKYPLKRVDGFLFHLTHPRGKNSRFSYMSERLEKFHLTNTQRILSYNDRIINEMNL